MCSIWVRTGLLRAEVAKFTTLITGTETDPIKFMWMLRPHHNYNMPSRFFYPNHRLLRLCGILSPDEICQPDTQIDEDEDSKDDEDEDDGYEKYAREDDDEDEDSHLAHLVIKRSFTSGTTIGPLTPFESHQRRYTS
jgi:hypothetical protein